MRLLPAISRNSLLLGIFAAATTLVIGAIYSATKDDIALAERIAEEKQLLEIIPSEKHDNSMLDDHFTVDREAPLLALRQSRRGYIARDGDRIIGVILPATARDGYSGDIRLLVGIYVDGTVAGVRVVTHRETPGLGDAIDLKKSDWILDFSGRSLGDPPAEQWRVKKDGGMFDQFTGATVTPRAVVNATRRALDYAEQNRARLFTADDAITPGEAT
ncbi:electron transport complex subunit RsxG [Luminiphilus syltensis]|uniref:electron transport complex subunit RsxG n=1 Tax=Luminiphilus syltensis TaxID=1341119 RepID=UPI0002E83FCA|nr:electron transport complex subunit RsxG [Luminiphilus syltensis]